MTTGKLNVLEHSPDDHTLTVGDAIHVHLDGLFKKLVYEHRPLGRRFDGKSHVVADFVVTVNNLHRAPTEHERRAHQHRVAKLVRRRERFFLVRRESVRRLRNPEPVEHCREQFPVFRDFDVLRRRADDVDTVLLESEREVQRRLAAELHDRTPALLALVNV